MKREIWKAENLLTDAVVDPYVKLPVPYRHSGRGISSRVTELKLDAKGDVASQKMECILNEPEDAEKILDPVIELLPEKRREVSETADELFSAMKKNVDVLTPSQLQNNPELLENVLRDGIRLYDGRRTES